MFPLKNGGEGKGFLNFCDTIFNVAPTVTVIISFITLATFSGSKFFLHFDLFRVAFQGVVIIIIIIGKSRAWGIYFTRDSRFWILNNKERLMPGTPGKIKIVNMENGESSCVTLEKSYLKII